MSEKSIDSVEAFEWGTELFRSRRVRIASCPQVETPGTEIFHELTVADCFPDELSHVYCSCGWVGPGAESDEKAVEQHNLPHGYGIEPVSDWSPSHANLTDQEIDNAWEF